MCVRAQNKKLLLVVIVVYIKNYLAVGAGCRSRCIVIHWKLVAFVRPRHCALSTWTSYALSKVAKWLHSTRCDESEPVLQDQTDRREQLQANMESFREAVETSFHTPKPSQHQLEDEDDVTRIYACATMWHETKEEMLQLLKSVLR